MEVHLNSHMHNSIVDLIIYINPDHTKWLLLSRLSTTAVVIAVNPDEYHQARPGLIWDEHMQVIFAVNLVNWVNKVN